MGKRPGKMTVAKGGVIGWMIFDNAARLNAMNMAMLREIPDIIADFESDDSIRVIVVRGVGEKAFSAGADISEFEEKRASKEAVEAFDAVDEAAERSVADARKPTVAMINGYCMGGGASFALCCDLRIAAENARFGVPAARLGVGYDYAGIKRMLDAVGPMATKEIFYTARQYTAEEALAMGLVRSVLPLAEIEGYVRELAETIGRNAPLTLRAVKTNVNEALKGEQERDMALCRQVVDDCFASQDYIEGRRAFMEKRSPNFQGR